LGVGANVALTHAVVHRKLVYMELPQCREVNVCLQVHVPVGFHSYKVGLLIFSHTIQIFFFSKDLMVLITATANYDGSYTLFCMHALCVTERRY